jgi:hypothetical protein
MINCSCSLIEQVIRYIHANMGKVENIGRILYYHQTNSDVHPRKQRNSVNRIAPANHDTVSLDRLRGSMTGHSSKYDCHLYAGWESLHVEIWGPHKLLQDSDKMCGPQISQMTINSGFFQDFPIKNGDFPTSLDLLLSV